MPFDTIGAIDRAMTRGLAAYRSPASNAEAAAFAFAASLDALARQDNPEPVEAALADVGELLGGLSIHGFAGDLRMHLERVEASLLEDAPRQEYNPGMGGNDPDVVFSSHLSDAIDTAGADDCREWLDSAREVLTKVLVLLSERAA
jgi:hypothetical protein